MDPTKCLAAVCLQGIEVRSSFQLKTNYSSPTTENSVDYGLKHGKINFNQIWHDSAYGVTSDSR